MDTHRFNLLGEFEYIAPGDRPVEIELAKNVGLLAILLRSREAACSRSKIIDLLWSDRCNDQGRASLRHALWSLKQAFGGESQQLLVADRKRVRLNLETCSADVFEFESLCRTDALRDRERALQLYRGEMLDGLSIRDRQWSEWLTIERENLFSSYVTAMGELCAFYYVHGSPHDLIAAGRRLIEQDPLSEQGHHAMMTGYLLSNQRSQALRQFRRYEKMVKVELNGFPGRDITELHDSIVAGTEIADFLPPGKPHRRDAAPMPGPLLRAAGKTGSEQSREEGLPG